MLYIGVDLGTSAVKLLVMDETRETLKRLFQKEYPLFFPGIRMVRQKPEDMVWKNRWREPKN